MYYTRRPQNRCNQCGYTWQPRGHNLSLECRRCRSRDVAIVKPGPISQIVGLVLLCAIGYGGYYLFSSIPSTSTGQSSQVQEGEQNEGKSQPLLNGDSQPPSEFAGEEGGVVEADEVPVNTPAKSGPESVEQEDALFLESLREAIRPRVEGWVKKLGTSRQSDRLQKWDERVGPYWGAFKAAYLARAQAKHPAYTISDEELADLANSVREEDGTTMLELLADSIALGQGVESAENFGKLLFSRLR